MTDQPILTNQQALITLASEAELLEENRELNKVLANAINRNIELSTQLQAAQDRTERVLVLSPEFFATEARDYSRGVAEGIRICQSILLEG